MKLFQIHITLHHFFFFFGLLIIYMIFSSKCACHTLLGPYGDTDQNNAKSKSFFQSQTNLVAMETEVIE